MLLSFVYRDRCSVSKEPGSTIFLFLSLEFSLLFLLFSASISFSLCILFAPPSLFFHCRHISFPRPMNSFYITWVSAWTTISLHKETIICWINHIWNSLLFAFRNEQITEQACGAETHLLQGSSGAWVFHSIIICWNFFFIVVSSTAEVLWQSALK